jgi:hypothetical protein
MHWTADSHFILREKFVSFIADAKGEAQNKQLRRARYKRAGAKPQLNSTAQNRSKSVAENKFAPVCIYGRRVSCNLAEIDH